MPVAQLLALLPANGYLFTVGYRVRVPTAFGLQSYEGEFKSATMRQLLAVDPVQPNADPQQGQSSFTVQVADYSTLTFPANSAGEQLDYYNSRSTAAVSAFFSTIMFALVTYPLIAITRAHKRKL